MSYDYVKTFRQKLKNNLVYVHGGKCALCGYEKCFSALEFHHINSDDKDFSLGANANVSTEKALLESQKCIILCANCHREVHSEMIDNEKLISTYSEERAKIVLEELYKQKEKTIPKCIDCGVEISELRATRCPTCASLARRVCDRPNREELKSLIRTLPFTSIAKKYGVSDRAIGKWCKAENLPNKKSEIKMYSDEEWEKI